MFVVKPRNLPPVGQELWITQQEFYPTTRGIQADYAAMLSSDPGVVAFNGYGNQYAEHPIPVRSGERIRMYLLNGGPTQWTSIHLIGAVYDRTYVEGVEGRNAQTVSLAPAQGGWVEFTLPQEGVYPVVDHDFADDSKGASGALRTANATGPVLAH
jgi:nitrite reductase (NO-forming)